MSAMIHRPHLELTDKARHAGCRVEITREVRRAREDHPPAGPGADGAGEHLHEGDRRRVDGHNLALAGPDEAGDLVARPLGERHPLFPAGDETCTPLLPGHLGQTARDRAREGAERVAVEVDDALRKEEARPHVGERVVAVERLAALPICRPGRHSTDLTSQRRGKKRSPSVVSR